ncbi:Ig-like domain-containing protein [Exiguobacterium sp. SL14]|nr:Ig-like domain-containing protein [Exiguobacterium sp. SL14]MCY1692370.1 Ig-like domain-containing protein [Exiguobacterium sp. SL14]
MTGTALAGGTITVKDAKQKKIATAKVDAKGTFSVKLPKQVGGSSLIVTVTDIAKRTSKPTVVKVLPSTNCTKSKIGLCGSNESNGYS